MAQNCNNTVTPKMIRNGQMKVGDTIQLEDFMYEHIPAQSNHHQQENTSYSKNKHDLHAPLCYEEITPYMNQVSLNQIEENMALNIPQTPLSTEMYTESLDVTDVQQFTGFLRTQIGRYMRIEQLIGSDTIRDRYGYLVGVGVNFIILQEAITGNIMLIDLFSIRLTYIYYADAPAI